MVDLPCEKRKAQISLEFLIVYSFVLIIFIILFTLIATQRAESLVQQQYSILQSQAQAIATYINQAVSSGSGYSVTLPLLGGFATHTYNISISSTGVVILGTKSGLQPITAYAFSSAKSFVINGTLVQSANGISVYQLQTYTGSISIYNSKGIIYIDKQPISTTNLAQGMLTTQQANVKAAQFNGQNSYVNLTTEPTWTNSLTVSAWLDTANPTTAHNYQEIFNNNQVFLRLSGDSGAENRIECFVKLSDGSVDPRASSIIAQPGNWYYVTCTWTGSTLSIYVNGVFQTGTSRTLSLNPTTGHAQIGAGEQTIPNINPFNGLIEDLQLYNTALSANAVNTLYQEGIGGAPLGYNVIGYWPLNGNTRDYGGGSNQGTPNNIAYQSTTQLDSLLIPASNSLVAPLAGYVASAGSIGTYGHSDVNYTNSGSLSQVFLSSNGASGSANVAVDFFNGNSSTQGNLIGWWPLDTGYGNVLYDLSGRYNNGGANGVAWKSTNLTNFAAASFPGDLGSVTGSNTQDGFITINSAQSLLSIGINSTFTVVGWIYYKGPTSSHSQGIIGDWLDPGAGFQLLGYCARCAGTAALYVNGSFVSFPTSANSFPANSWEMITAQYNGSTGLANIYLNRTLFASNVLPKQLGLVQPQPMYIGDDAWQTSGLDTFNGMITNLQLYSAYLTQNQVGALYAQGPASTPLGDTGLVSWWPLAGNPNDYSFNNNTGSMQYNVIFQNGNYTGMGEDFAYFNGLPTSNGMLGQVDSISGNQLSVFAWVDPSNVPQTLPTVISKFGATVDDYQLGLQQSGSSFLVMACSHVGAYANCSTSSSAIGTNEWSYVGYTYDGYYMRIYVNGQLDKVVQEAGSLSSSSDPLMIGETSLGLKQFRGSMADVQLYNTMLTPQQIMQLYAQGLPIQNRLNASFG